MCVWAARCAPSQSRPRNRLGLRRFRRILPVSRTYGIGDKKTDTPLSAEEKEVAAQVSEIFQQHCSRYGDFYITLFQRPWIEKGRDWVGAYYIEWKSVSIEVLPYELKEADKLNGIGWRGMVFTARGAAREYFPDGRYALDSGHKVKGWTEWRNPYGTFGNERDLWSFDAEKRDGKWKLTQRGWPNGVAPTAYFPVKCDVAGVAPLDLDTDYASHTTPPVSPVAANNPSSLSGVFVKTLRRRESNCKVLYVPTLVPLSASLQCSSHLSPVTNQQKKGDRKTGGQKKGVKRCFCKILINLFATGNGNQIGTRAGPRRGCVTSRRKA